MKKNVFKVMVLGAMLTGTAAFAQDDQQPLKQKDAGGKNGQEMFIKLDADKDGKLSKAEVEKSGRAKFTENFATIDTNKDNYLDKEELAAYRKEQKGKRLAKAQ